MASASPALTPHPLAGAICQALADVFAQKFGSAWTVDSNVGEASPGADAKQISFGITVAGAFHGNAALALTTSDAALLAQNFTDPPAEFNDEQKNSAQALLQEITSMAGGLLQNQFGSIKLEVSSIEPPTWQGTGIVLRVTDTTRRAVTLYLLIGNELMEAMVSNPSISTTTESGKKTIVSDTNLDLLMGVDLTLTLRFGTRTLTLREILDLTSGSVVELDRQVQEPADLLLGDKLIARGEVVIVDGNYGLRITELPEQGQTIAKSIGA
jgi:flagellar motor switch protein FliN/FliY